MTFGPTPTPTEQRFWQKVEKESLFDCWLWRGQVSQPGGYGHIFTERKPRVTMVLVHRFAYELLVGPIPEGLVIDHTCRVRHCVNPSHLEPVTQAENLRRARANKKRSRGALNTPAPTRAVEAR